MGMRLLVVGGSSGIGRALATVAMDDGHDVIVAARRTVEGMQCIPLDVRQQASIVRAFEAIPALDAVVYAAGVAPLAPLAECSPSQWRETLETNVVGAAEVAGQAVRLLAESNGVLLFCSSTMSQEHRWGLGAYGVSKAGLSRLIDGLHEEYPDIRFVQAILGAVLGTEFATTWDAAQLTDAINTWTRRGQLPANAMSLRGLGEVLLSLLTTLIAHPDVAIPAVTLEPPGGSFLPK